MPWYAVRPRDPADPRWPLPGKPQLILKGDDPADALHKFEQAYPSKPFGTPATPVPDGTGGFDRDAEALIVEETAEPAAPAS